MRRQDDGGFVVETDRRTLRASRVLLAVGRRGTPRRLGVPGEELEKVAYRLLDPEQVRHSHVLVVGGGDSAIEAACALAGSPGNRVTLCHRSAGLERAKEMNRRRLDAMVANGAVALRLSTTVAEIAADRVSLTGPDGDVVLANDRVYVFAGGVLPTQLLVDAGIEIARHFGGRVEVLGGESP